MKNDDQRRAPGLALPTKDGFAVFHQRCRCPECIAIASEIRREERGIVDELAAETRYALRGRA